MKKSILFVAPPGARNKKVTIFKEIVSLCPGNDYSSVLYICPNSFHLGEAERDFHEYLKSPAYIPFQSFTLKQFAERIFQKRESGTHLIPGRIRPLIIAELLSEKNAGYTRLLSDLLSRLKHYIPGKELFAIRDQAVSCIFEEKTSKRAAGAIDGLITYEGWKSERGISDSEDVLKMSIPAIHESEEMPVVVIDGFFDPTPLELEVITAIAVKAGHLLILAESSSGMYTSLPDRKDYCIIKLASDLQQRMAPHASHPSLEEEVESMARDAKALLLEGAYPSEIVVSFPALNKYIPSVKRIFSKHGVPLSIEEKDLSSSHHVVALDSILTCIEEDYPSYDFLALLTSPAFPQVDPLLKERGVAYAYSAGIIKGKGAWLSLKDIMLSAMTEKISGEDAVYIEGVQNRIQEIISLIENIKRKKRLPEFIDALSDTLGRLGFFNNSEYSEVTAMVEERFADARLLHNICVRTSMFESRPVPLLRSLLEDMKAFSTKESGVRILPFELAAGVESEALFFGGAIEGDLPSRPLIDPILPEHVKKELGLPDLEYFIGRQKRYFNMLLYSSRREPSISRPSAEGDNLLLQSPFLEWDAVRSPSTPNIFSEEEIHRMEGIQELRREVSTISSRIDTGPYFKGYMSVTDIDSYRRCPQRFYIQKVLNIVAGEPPKFEVEARLWGTLAHKTMEHLFKDGEIDIESIEERLFEGLTRALGRFPVADFWSSTAHDIFRRLLPGLKEQERRISADGFAPLLVEKKVAAEIGSLKLKGKIDRIDIKKQTTEDRMQDLEEKNIVRIIDYKTGVSDKESMQLPLYAAIWQKERPDSVERAGVYSLREGSVTWYPSRVSMAEYIEAALEKAEEIVTNIRRGEFPPEPHHAQECRYCYHKPLCKGAKY